MDDLESGLIELIKADNTLNQTALDYLRLLRKMDERHPELVEQRLPEIRRSLRDIRQKVIEAGQVAVALELCTADFRAFLGEH